MLDPSRQKLITAFHAQMRETNIKTRFFRNIVQSVSKTFLESNVREMLM